MSAADVAAAAERELGRAGEQEAGAAGAAACAPGDAENAAPGENPDAESCDEFECEGNHARRLTPDTQRPLEPKSFVQPHPHSCFLFYIPMAKGALVLVIEVRRLIASLVIHVVMRDNVSFHRINWRYCPDHRGLSFI